MDVGDEYLDGKRFFDLVDYGGLPPDGSLEGASGQRAAAGPYETSLIRRVEQAWRTPFRDLTCGQVSTLVSQKMGLEWLGRPAIAFAARYPGATLRFYPGELVLACLRAAEELLALAEPECSQWLEGDFGWFEDVFGEDRSLLKEAQRALSDARSIAGRQNSRRS